RRIFRRGTNGSNPFSSTSESAANLIGGSRATSRLESGRTITAVSGAVLENVRFAIDGEDHRAFVGVGLVERPDPSPDEFAGTANAVVIVERTLDDEGLLGLRVP